MSSIKNSLKNILKEYYGHKLAIQLKRSVVLLAEENYKEAASNDENMIAFLHKISGDKRIKKLVKKDFAPLLINYMNALDSVALFQKDSEVNNQSVSLFNEAILSGKLGKNLLEKRDMVEFIKKLMIADTRILANDTYKWLYNNYVKNCSDITKANVIRALLDCNCGYIDYKADVIPIFERYGETLDRFFQKIDLALSEGRRYKKTLSAAIVFFTDVLYIADHCFFDLDSEDRYAKKILNYCKEHTLVSIVILNLIVRLLAKDRCVLQIKEYIAHIEAEADPEVLEKRTNGIEQIKRTILEIETGELQPRVEPDLEKVSDYRKLIEFVQNGDFSSDEACAFALEFENKLKNEIKRERKTERQIKLLKTLYRVKYARRRAEYWRKYNKALNSIEKRGDNPDTVYYFCNTSSPLSGSFTLPLMLEAKKEGCICVPSSYVYFDFDSDDKILNEIAGCMYFNSFWRYVNTGRYQYDYSLNIENKEILLNGMNIYEPLFEVISRWQFGYFFNFKSNAWARGQVQKHLLQFSKTFYVCEKLTEWAAQNKKKVRFLGVSAHVENDAACRIFCEYNAHRADIAFVNIRSGYDDYFNINRDFKTNSLTALNLTKYNNKRMSIYGTDEGYEHYCKKNQARIEELREICHKCFTFQRSNQFGLNDTEDERERKLILDKITSHKKNGGKVVMMNGKIIYDLASKYTKGCVHDDMSHWATHTVEIAKKNKDVLLLIKPHPHETNKEITMTEETAGTFRDLILGDFEEADNIIYLKHHLFRNMDLAPYLDVGLTWNGTSTLEFAAMGLKVNMGDECSYHDFPIGIPKVHSLEEYEDFICHCEKYEMPDDLADKAILFLSYIGSRDVSIPNPYTSCVASNYHTWDADIDFDAVKHLNSENDESLERLFAFINN